MKPNYSIKAILMFIIIALSFTNLNAQENVRILRVDPATNSITLKNFGDMDAPISGYWFCVRPAYAQVSGMTSVTTLAPGAEIDIASSVNLSVASGEFALYNSPSFGSSGAMLDFLQWGTGASSSREATAVAAGLWVANTFITAAPPYEYTGDGTQNGVANWGTLSTPEANVRILRVDPATNSITLKNFGDATATISGYWFCVRPAYAQLNNMTSVTTLAPNEELNIASSVNLVASSGEFALYNSPSFGSSAAMLDFLQWGTGASSSRESTAVAAGLWVANTFITVAPPYEYNGDGTQNGVANWSTLGIDDFEQGSSLRLYPNPTSTILNIEFKTVITDGSIEVFDLLGKQVFAQSITSNSISQIDVANWDSGVYLIKMSSENGQEIKRFIKQ